MSPSAESSSVPHLMHMPCMKPGWGGQRLSCPTFVGAPALSRHASSCLLLRKLGVVNVTRRGKDLSGVSYLIWDVSGIAFLHLDPLFACNKRKFA